MSQASQQTFLTILSAIPMVPVYASLGTSRQLLLYIYTTQSSEIVLLFDPIRHKNNLDNISSRRLKYKKPDNSVPV